MGLLTRHIAVALYVLFASISLAQAEAPVTADAVSKTNEAAAISESEAEPEGVIGTAAYYAKRFHGRRTHSGTKHDRKGLTAAHPTLPHGTRVKVINLANNRSVIVTVNDRCRKRKGEFIDLSRAAARQLGFLGRGQARVRIIPLEEEE